MRWSMANMNEVAKLAGVSKSTVSKVINGYDSLAPETIRKVNKAINELGYVPNVSAASLSKKNIKKIGVLLKVNDIDHVIDEIYMHYLLGIDAACSQQKIENSIIFTNGVEDKSCDQLIAYLYSKSITSLIIIGMAKDDLVLNQLVKRQAFPTVVAEALVQNRLTSNVGINNFDAQYQIAKQAFVQWDPNSVLYIEGKTNGFVSEYRKQGLLNAAKEFDFELDFYNGEFSEDKVYNHLLVADKDYDLIVCASDLMAIGVKRALITTNKRCHIVGFDGINLLSYVADDIPTVKQDFYQLAIEAVNEAIRLQDGAKSQSVEIPYTIQCVNK